MINFSLAEFQLKFLNQIQSRLLESKVLTSYKYALLHAIADRCVLKTMSDPSEQLKISVIELAEVWLELFAGHTHPYPSHDGMIQSLCQGSVKGETVLTLIDEYRSMSSSMQANQRPLVLREICKRLENPITRLYSGGLSKDNFLYCYQGSTLTLKPYIGFCFREHHSLVTQLIRERWLTFVRKQNRHRLAEAQELSSFLFGSKRASLGSYFEALKQSGEQTCFYCEASNAKLVVDHFIPWSIYAVDYGHNFVLACVSCNSSKSDQLASLSYLGRWLKRNVNLSIDLQTAFEERSLSHNAEASLAIADWAYRRHLSLGGELWLKRGVRCTLERPSLDDLKKVLGY